jgi:hypothetical protein
MTGKAENVARRLRDRATAERLGQATLVPVFAPLLPAG